MKFKDLKKDKRLMKGYEILIYNGAYGDKIYDDILPVGISKQGIKEYTGLVTKKERDYHDSVFEELGNREIVDKDVDNEYKQIFIYLEKENLRWK